MKMIYAVVIARCLEQILQLISGASNLATYFRSLQASEIIAEHEKRGKYLAILLGETCDN